ncbi:MAG: glycosyltransferase family 2 protein [Chitinispirillaceae bacterium]|nr:glycosyltransferase family 2 protein [Chitinispirillaceae bacterium]
MCEVKDNIKQRIFLVIPVFNEEENISRLLDRIKEVMLNTNLYINVYVVDDGSKDKTYNIVETYSKDIPISIIKHEHNMGLGYAIRSGLLKVIKDAKDNDIAIVMDGDNTHPPYLILQMAQKINEGFDVVIASRFLKDSKVVGVPFYRNILSRVASFLMRIFFPIKGVRDYTCGYRAYRVSILKSAEKSYKGNLFTQQGFQCMVDILLKLKKSGAIFVEVPLLLRYDYKKGKSKMKITKTIWNTLLLVFKHHPIPFVRD